MSDEKVADMIRAERRADVRRVIATAAMTGLLADGVVREESEIAARAVRVADALLLELAKPSCIFCHQSIDGEPFHFDCERREKFTLGIDTK